MIDLPDPVDVKLKGVSLNTIIAADGPEGFSSAGTLLPTTEADNTWTYNIVYKPGTVYFVTLQDGNHQYLYGNGDNSTDQWIACVPFDSYCTSTQSLVKNDLAENKQPKQIETGGTLNFTPQDPSGESPYYTGIKLYSKYWYPASDISTKSFAYLEYLSK